MLFGTDLTSLKAAFTLSAGASASVNGVVQQSGVTANNYNNALTYTVTAEDGSTKDYTVIVRTTGSAVTGVLINGTNVNITEGSSFVLTSRVLPDTASKKGVNYSVTEGQGYIVLSNQTNSTVTVTGVTAGTSTITATTAEGGKTATMTVTVTAPAANNANCAMITVSKGVLQGAFNTGATSYLAAPIPFSDSAAPMYSDTQSADITVTAADKNATVTINGTRVASGGAYIFNNIPCGATLATVVITAVDGSTTKTYKVTLYRALPVFKTGAGPLSGYTLDPREDGATQRGVSWPNPRFVDNGDGTITDRMTGLIWLKFSGIGGQNWSDAITYCENLTTGANDWRMPNIRELMSLMNYSRDLGGWLQSQGFTGLMRSYFTSTTPADSAGCSLDSENGNKTSTIPPLGNTEFLVCLAVRLSSDRLPVTGQSTVHTAGDDGTYQKGVAFPLIRFRDNGDGTMTDNMTGLVWLKNVGSATYTWTQALDYVDTLNSAVSGNGGYHDWRLPTSNEFDGLNDYSQRNPYTWLNNQGFSGVINDLQNYWSSTTFYTSGSSARSYHMGFQKYQLKTTNCPVWPVRGGN
jgi:hypothetical protein